MRKLVVSTLVSLDGVVQDPGGFGETDQGGWAGALFDDAARAAAIEQVKASDYFLLGRVTYELPSRAWAGNSGEYRNCWRRYPSWSPRPRCTGSSRGTPAPSTAKS